MEFFTLVFIVIILAAALLVFYYNKFVKLRNQAEESWSGIDVQLKRRYDLIPNLVETVKGYATHEKETLEQVIKARNMAQSAENLKEKGRAENFLTDTLKSIFALSESYPDLKANENFAELQRTLQEIEDQIQLARRYYNAVVRDLNTAVEAFPSNIVAGLFNFGKREYFEIQESER